MISLKIHQNITIEPIFKNHHLFHIMVIKYWIIQLQKLIMFCFAFYFKRLPYSCHPNGNQEAEFILYSNDVKKCECPLAHCEIVYKNHIRSCGRKNH